MPTISQIYLYIRSGGETPSKSSKSAANTIVDERRSLSLRMPLWVVTSMADLIVFAAAWILILSVYHVIGEDATQNPFRGSDIILPFMAVMVVYDKLSIPPGSDLYKIFMTLAIHGSIAGMLMVTSAVTLRLRIIYKIWICNDIHASYCFGLIYHVPLMMVATTPTMILDLCRKGLSFSQLYWPIFGAYVFFFAECGFYFWKIKRISSILVDFSSTLRIGAMVLGMFSFQLIYEGILGRLDIIAVLSFFFMTPATLFVIWLEILGPALVKITGRKLRASFLGGLDLWGIADELGSRGFDDVLSDPYLSEKFTESCTKMYCTENVIFLKGMLNVRNALSSVTNHAGSGHEPLMEINISSQTREIILDEMSYLRSDLISDALLRSLDEAEERVCSMLMSAKADFLTDAEVSAHLRRMWASERAGLVVKVVAEHANV
ncbi:hypothetical protein SARC_08535 [Sphaeroforma arctica JP610]|uniref:RGS domain-containing protein n=1 Tax=Sphaeroforma arctica JP610 TaxID=667725 RepID=A0A0L0FQV1_9EUKA|nr:hypothetical protein SARC_08535 [Sphaeroforma arctica JP610]KNC79059.1 hypothetical protein SARC_08535 [Sphaeroforma arctica JP610]|eukprot:XP_014152961.1 hypothetical protein SARC_08535 [Sphaeroforma arctica JP610]